MSGGAAIFTRCSRRRPRAERHDRIMMRSHSMNVIISTPGRRDRQGIFFSAKTQRTEKRREGHSTPVLREKGSAAGIKSGYPSAIFPNASFSWLDCEVLESAGRLDIMIAVFPERSARWIP